MAKNKQDAFRENEIVSHLIKTVIFILGKVDVAATNKLVMPSRSLPRNYLFINQSKQLPLRPCPYMNYESIVFRTKKEQERTINIFRV